MDTNLKAVDSQMEWDEIIVDDEISIREYATLSGRD